MTFSPSTEGFSSTPDGGVVASGEGATQMYALLSNTHSLALEINTGMKRSGGASIIVWAKTVGLTTKQTKRGVLADLVKAIQKVDPNYQPSRGIASALAK